MILMLANMEKKNVWGLCKMDLNGAVFFCLLPILAGGACGLENTSSYTERA